ncbi:chaperonin-like RbcX protein 2, chloroplastic [Magnolia sinica]|uniref:chaperonin-like RbcX protein 2, chloroplastic n=1 Tax=Magnolia sinica TaxID=86752 RepID=UPI002658815D|nr:chaperonin-like RbcX protein 2, chloroplastic [Magnolia sinica]
MVGAASMAGLAVDSHMCPCLCVDTLSVSNVSFKSSGDLGLYRNSMGRKQSRHSAASLELSSSFVDTWHDWRLSGKIPSGIIRLRPRRKLQSLVILNEAAGQYDDTFEDVTKQIVNYFTYKATRTVLNQLYEMNPPQYRWFYDFIVTNDPGEGKRFIRTLAKEKHELAERVMITRLHLYSKWVKICDHAKIYQQISDQNLELMRERLMETVVWPSDDTNTGKIG